MSESPIIFESAINSLNIAVLVSATLVSGLAAWLGWTSKTRAKSVAPGAGEAISDADTRISYDQTASGTAVASPYEVIALSRYYDDALMRANVSFWFSISFGCIGFALIVLSVLTHQSVDVAGTVAKLTSGIVMDAVSLLFYRQSVEAQKSMTAFFQDLRSDRLNVEARTLIDNIQDAERADQLRAQLVLKYAGIDKLVVDQ